MTQTIFTLPKDGVRKKVRNSRRAGELGVLPQQERPLYHHTRAKWYSWKHVYVSMQKLVVATPQSAPPLMLDSLFEKKGGWFFLKWLWLERWGRWRGCSHQFLHILTTACFHEFNFVLVGWRRCFACSYFSRKSLFFLNRHYYYVSFWKMQHRKWFLRGLFLQPFVDSWGSANHPQMGYIFENSAKDRFIYWLSKFILCYVYVFKGTFSPISNSLWTVLLPALMLVTLVVS